MFSSKKRVVISIITYFNISLASLTNYGKFNPQRLMQPPTVIIAAVHYLLKVFKGSRTSNQREKTAVTSGPVLGFLVLSASEQTKQYMNTLP